MAKTVQLQSENERLAASGVRKHTGRSSDLNQAYANRFTRHYEDLCRQYPIYRELQNVFRLSLVAGLLQTSQVQSQVEWSGDWLVEGVRSAVGAKPNEVPSIVNHRVINRKHVIVGVSGGVSMNVARYLRKMPLTDRAAEIKSAQQIGEKTVNSARWWWD